GAVGSPDQIFLFKGTGQPATLEELSRGVKEEVARQTEIKRKEVALDHPTIDVPQAELAVIIDIHTGNIGLAERSGGATVMTHDQIAPAMGLTEADAINATLEFRGDIGRWVLNVRMVGTSARALFALNDQNFWYKMLAGLQAHPEGHLLDGMLIEILGN